MLGLDFPVYSISSYWSNFSIYFCLEGTIPLFDLIPRLRRRGVSAGSKWRERHGQGNYLSEYVFGVLRKAERESVPHGSGSQRRVLLGAAVELHFLDAPVNELFRRAQLRGMENPPITREDLQRWSDAFEKPTPEELALFDAQQLSFS